MKTPADLSIFIAPSPSEGLWRDAISKAATAQGWMVETSETESEDADRNHPRLAFMSGLECVAIEADLVLTQPPQTSGNEATFSPFDQAEASRHRSVGFACAAQLVAANAAVADARSLSIILPGIGRVDRPDHATSESCERDEALAIYHALPLVGGETVEWKPSLFVYPNSTSELDVHKPRIDLSGRARPLVLGPWITLPRGLWRVAGRFEIDTEGGCEFLDLRWGVDDDVVHLHVDLDVSGVYNVIIERFWEQPGRAEFRIYARQPHFKGQITFLGCTVEHVNPKAEAPPEIDLEAMPILNG